MSGDTRVVLVKPGDVLIFGNVGDIDWDEQSAAAIADLKKQLGLAQILVFMEDIDLASTPSGPAA